MQDLHQETRHNAAGALKKIRARPVAVVIRLSALGDVLLTASALAKLSATHDVIFITEPAYAPLAAALPGVAEVRPLSRRDGIRGALSLGIALRALEPALVLDFQAKVRSQALARFTGAPVATLHRRTLGQAVRALFGSDTVLDAEHQTQRYEAMLPVQRQPEEKPRMTLDPRWIEEAARIAGAARPVAVAPAATHATKGWGPANYAALVRRTVAPGTPLLVVGGPSDSADLRIFREALGDWPGMIDASSLPLTTLAALIARCQLLVGNDSGPIHLAALLGVPTVALFGPTSARRWGPPPYEDGTHRAVSLQLTCSPCSNHGGKQCPLGHHHCMKQLTVDRVVQEIESLTSSGAIRSSPR